MGLAVYVSTQGGSEFVRSKMLDAEPVDLAFHDVDQPTEFEDDPTPVGDGEVLVAVSSSEESLQGRVVTSSDLGATWEPVRLPNPPQVPLGEYGLEVFDIDPLDGMVAVTARLPVAGPTREPHYVPYVWVTDDGVGWRGGPLPDPAPDRPSDVWDVWRGVTGEIYVTLSFGGDPGHVVLRSSDGGAPWVPSDCPVPADESYDHCDGLQQAGDMWVRSDNLVSLDQGATWEEPDIPGLAGRFLHVFDVVERADGGWLAVVSWSEDDPADDDDHLTVGVLLRSDDGRVWERVLDHDPRCAEDESFTTPVPLGRRWLVAYTCWDPKDWSLQRQFLTELAVLDADGTHPSPVLGTFDRTHHYDQPFVFGDDVVVLMLPNPGLPTLRVFDAA